MGTQGKREYLEAIRKRYHLAGKKEKRVILDEFCEVCDYNRKYAIRLLSRLDSIMHQSAKNQAGRPKKYYDPVVFEVLKRIWTMLNLPCSKRLKAALPSWLPHYEAHYRTTLTQDERTLLNSISSATIDRLIAPMRAKAGKYGLCTTKPGSLLKQHIPIATDQWNETRPGFLEADTVAHCGTSMEGMFVFTVNCVDIATQWREQRAVWGKGERKVLEALKDIEQKLPFPLLGFDCDNGSEFLNWHIHKYLTKRRNPVQYTRSRPYHKNDNAHVEEKNWTLVRQYIGYQRLAKSHLAQELNDLYRSEWRLFMNFFVPSTKLIDKHRDGSRIHKKYDLPKTPLQRTLESPHIADATKEELRKLFLTLDPFVLQRHIQSKINSIINQAEPLPKYIFKHAHYD